MFNESQITPAYVASCRERINAQIECYNQLIATAKDEYTTNEALDETIANFEPVFFNNLLLVMESYFDLKAQPDSQHLPGALQEVRLLCSAIRHNHNQLGNGYTTAVDPEQMVLKLAPGSTIRLNETNFITLANAYLNEMEKIANRQ